ncbi:MAG: hypothetical protein NC483_02975 [Ruminococcus sp.]|nr:hypothetical protein [Ruminococcus sp.]
MTQITAFEKENPTDTWIDKTTKIKLNMRNATNLVKEANRSDSLDNFSLLLLPDLSDNDFLTQEKREEKDQELEEAYLAICKLSFTNISLDAFLEKIKEIINPSNIRYNYLINKIKLRLYKELLSYTKLYLDCENEEEALEVKAIMDEIKLKISCLLELKEVEELISGAKSDNNLFFLTSGNGDVIFYNSLFNIPFEYYFRIYELLESLKNGNFRRVKRVVSKPYFEVRLDMIRILFDKLSDGNYIIIDIFIKRNSTKKYKERLKNRTKQYLQLKDYFLLNHQNKDFISEHNRYYQDIITLLESRGIGERRIRC